MGQRWSKERIWEWYNNRPWMRGCNYMSASSANRVDTWQELGFEERMVETEQELALVRDTGFNTVRIIPEFVVWQKEHDGFMERFDRYLDVCQKYGLSCMVVLANDCMPPKTERWKLPDVGPQTYDWGYHGGRKHSQHGTHTGPAPHYYLDDPVTAAEYFEMVRELITKYKDDERICIWDLYNEAGNSQRDALTMPNITKMFEIAREIDPIQPLTACVWRLRGEMKTPLSEVEQYALDHSDIISYHFYEGFLEHVKLIKRLKQEGRPIVNTEWLARCLHNDVFDVFPLFYLEKIGCYNWGFVAGKYQTYEPWEGMWDRYYSGEFTDVDFTKWFHDLYRPNLRPYDPKEIDLIKHLCKLADQEFENS